VVVRYTVARDEHDMVSSLAVDPDRHHWRKEATMRHLPVVALALAVGIGVTGCQILNAQDLPVKRTMLVQTALAGVEGKEANMYITEIGPGVDAGRHYHHGHTFVYILDGTITVQEAGKSPMTYGPGQALQEPPKAVHDAKNASATAPLKLLVFQVLEKGQPLAVPVK
jgi:quercetin dioxygenase-like cupin family protein